MARKPRHPSTAFLSPLLGRPKTKFFGKNYLESFDVYRNLDFDSEQVKEFIGKWFVKNSELGKDLQKELEKSGKERIRDLIKNPLRLTLLCWFWQRRQGSFPETKAGLYKRFVEVFYEWKEWEPDPFATQSEARENLKVALGELAFKAIDKNYSRFRLSHREVCEVLGDVDTPLFKLVMKLGWLNKLGVAEENPDEEIYAFFHPTFQEYFAAINVGDRYFFLNHIPENPDRGTYRIFESQWKEVFLLWLGRDDVKKDEKEELIKALVEFEDGCGNFYWYKAYFLAASGIAEFKECTIAKVIVEKVVLFCLKQLLPLNIHQLAYQTLLETDYTIASKFLISFLNINESNSVRICLDAANMLIQMQTNLDKVIAAMAEILESCNEEHFYFYGKEYAARVLLKIYPENIKAKEIFLASDLWVDEIEEEHHKQLQNFYLENSKNIDELLLDLCRSQDNTSRLQLVQKLAEMDIFSSQNFYTFTEVLRAIPENNSLYYSISQDENQLRYLIIELLAEIGRLGMKNSDIIAYLIELLDEKEWSSTIPEIEADDKTKSSNLKSRENPFIIKSTKNVTEENIIFRQIRVVKSLGEIGYNNQNAINTLTQIIHSKRHIKIRYQAAISLGKINPGNQAIIPLLIHLLINLGAEKTFLSELEYSDTIIAAKNILIQQLNSNSFQGVVIGLKGFLRDFLSEVKPNFHYNYRAVNDIVWHCTQNMTYPNFYLAWHSNNSTIQNLENQITDISKQLQPTTKTYPIFIDASPLKNETDTEAIAQEIYNQIHQTIYPNDENIPEIKNAPQLKRLIPKIKNHLNTKHLALIFHKSNPHPETVAFCHKLTNALHIAWLTDSPLEPPPEVSQ
ncbi:MAG: hypothetical protein AAGJ08_28180 [Cyanobacteria bacterium P01_H01_bin.35]